MKKFLAIMICIFILGFGISIASAETVRAKVHVEADDNGVVSVSGEGASQFTTVQYCTDKYADGCGDNVALGITNGSFALDKKGLKYHQNAFNLTTASGTWLRIPNWENVTTGKNVVIEKGKGGSMFIYTGPIPQ